MGSIIDYYNQFDEWGRLEREPVEFMVNFHFIKQYLKPGTHVLDNGAGPGKYAVALAQEGYDVTLTDLSPRLVGLAAGKVKECKLEERFRGIHVADARDLGRFEDGRFDAVMMLGPLYHLQQEEDRKQAARELFRVVKPGGHVFVAFMSRTRHLINSLLHPQSWKPNDTMDGIDEFMRTGVFNHSDDGRFTEAYYFPIDEIRPFMEQHGFDSVKLIASGSVVQSMNEEQWAYWRGRGPEEYQRFLNRIMEAAEDPYILGASSHLLYIGVKPQ
ncbi:class I SAM-dependent methyltransferase [Paenibacillus sp. PSB04]|uniref:class I SAM-dependent methyltransferase n=1 Tax=Paenibacillus sp. PSB04 TaxID=2866810 RepID=UPI0021F1224D|nr:class I SAM-dependent methyltransferase [Paenibacillus sp. PSB04]UYO03475.1 methyltransferase domain-containing protein [Paenibacillus sp. PSB04]